MTSTNETNKNMAIVTVFGNDHVGIIGGICSKLAQLNINILDISQTVMHGNFSMMMYTDLTACALSLSDVRNMLALYGEENELTIHIQRTDIFDAMHEI